jgi:hypothetical protein
MNLAGSYPVSYGKTNEIYTKDGKCFCLPDITIIIDFDPPETWTGRVTYKRRDLSPACSYFIIIA